MPNDNGWTVYIDASTGKKIYKRNYFDISVSVTAGGVTNPITIPMPVNLPAAYRVQAEKATTRAETNVNWHKSSNLVQVYNPGSAFTNANFDFYLTIEEI